MEDDPRTAAEFARRFESEAACGAYLTSMRWPDGFVCPRCQGRGAWRTARRLFHCRACGRETSVTAGTVFEGTRKPLRLWFQVLWWLVGQKQGASALGLNRVLGIGSYTTAWTWLQKIRRAMVRPGRERLTGRVEVDESFVGGVEEGGGRRHIGKKALVAIAAEVRGRHGIGRIRMRRVADSSAESLGGFVRWAVAEGSTVVTDGLPSYDRLKATGYRHALRVVLGSGKEASALLPGVHRVAALLKRWLLGTHQGAVSREHLDYYLDEFTFRFNQRSSRDRGQLFRRLIEQAVVVEPAPYRSLVRGVSPRRGRRPKRLGVT